MTPHCHGIKLIVLSDSGSVQARANPTQHKENPTTIKRNPGPRQHNGSTCTNSTDREPHNVRNWNHTERKAMHDIITLHTAGETDVLTNTAGNLIPSLPTSLPLQCQRHDPVIDQHSAGCQGRSRQVATRARPTSGLNTLAYTLARSAQPSLSLSSTLSQTHTLLFSINLSTSFLFSTTTSFSLSHSLSPSLSLSLFSLSIYLFPLLYHLLLSLSLSPSPSLSLSVPVFSTENKLKRVKERDGSGNQISPDSWQNSKERCLGAKEGLAGVMDCNFSVQHSAQQPQSTELW